MDSLGSLAMNVFASPSLPLSVSVSLPRSRSQQDWLLLKGSVCSPLASLSLPCPMRRTGPGVHCTPLGLLLANSICTSPITKQGLRDGG